MRRKSATKWLLLCIAGLLLPPAAKTHAQPADGLHAGPLFDQFSPPLTAGSRTEAFGPLFYADENDERVILAVPPLFSHASSPATDFTEFDLLYPVLTYRRYGGEYRWQLLQVLSFAGGRDQSEDRRRRFTLFPLYFQQRSTDPADNYTALFPFYGRLKKRLYRDEIFFVIYPLYIQSRKADVVTDNYLYPFFHLRRGEALHGWQFWPLIGHEHKEPTTRTNRFGDAERVGGHDHWFALWPLYFKLTDGIGTENPQKQVASLPFFSLLRSPQRDSTTVLWPFFSHITDRQRKYSEWQLPWPFVIFARGEGKTTSRVWPFFSHAHNANLESGFCLWPLYKYNRLQAGTLDRQRTRILFFLYSDTVEKNTETGAARRRVDFWPLFTHRREANGSTRLQLFAPLEPILSKSKSIERNYSPLWSLWRAEKNTETGAASQSLLWNLYRRETAPESKKCSLLFGLFQYQSSSEGRRLRLFYIPVAKARAPVYMEFE